MSGAAPAYLLDSHLSAGDGWVLSRGRAASTGEQVLLVSGDTGDLLDLRRRLAVAGSVAGAHLAAAVSVEERAVGGVVVVVDAPSGPSVAAVVASRGRLAAGEVVTLVAPLALALATLHARGIELADVTAATVWLTADGQPLMLPVGCRDVADPAVGGGGARADLVALATMALGVLDDASAGAGRVAAALHAAAEGRLDAAGLGASVLRSAPVLPIAAATVTASPVSVPSVSPTRRALMRTAAVVGAVVVAGVVLGGVWGRHDGDVVAAAPPLLTPALGSAAARATPAAATSPDDWRTTVSALERLRAQAYATGDAAALSSVYAASSPTGRSDERMLRTLTRHGRRAAGLQVVVERVDVVARTDNRVTLLVTDALTAYDVVARDGHVLRHGSGRPDRTWRMTLVQTPSGWRIWSVATAAMASRPR